MMDMVMNLGLRNKQNLEDRNDTQNDALDNLIRKEREKEKEYLSKSMSWIVDNQLVDDFQKRTASVKNLGSMA